MLIDGLHRRYEPEYAHLPERDRELIETARAPFDGIDLILVSHTHLDHFHAEAVRRHLEHNPSVRLLSSQQVTHEVRRDAGANDAVVRRITTEVTESGIELRVLGLRHPWRRWRSLQNLGHVITIGGKKVLHVGDAEAAADMSKTYNLMKSGLYYAILAG